MEAEEEVSSSSRLLRTVGASSNSNNNNNSNKCGDDSLSSSVRTHGGHVCDMRSSTAVPLCYHRVVGRGWFAFRLRFQLNAECRTLLYVSIFIYVY